MNRYTIDQSMIISTSSADLQNPMKTAHLLWARHSGREDFRNTDVSGHLLPACTLKRHTHAGGTGAAARAASSSKSSQQRSSQPAQQRSSQPAQQRSSQPAQQRSSQPARHAAWLKYRRALLRKECEHAIEQVNQHRSSSREHIR